MLRRLILTAALALTPTFLAAQNLAPQDPPACKIDDYCIRDQFLRIDLDDFRIRDTIANISLTYTNPTPEDYELSIYSIYLIATSANNERIELSTNRQRIFIGAGATRTEAFSLKFAEPVGAGTRSDLHLRKPRRALCLAGDQGLGFRRVDRPADSTPPRICGPFLALRSALPCGCDEQDLERHAHDPAQTVGFHFAVVPFTGGASRDGAGCRAARARGFRHWRRADA